MQPIQSVAIVGAGNNGCILHYTDNDGLIADGDLVLVDAGCEFESYAADVTRTFPANGKFTEPQKALYNIVLAAQDAAIEAIKPGNHWDQPHLAAVHVITKGLVELGLLQGDVQDLVDNEAYKKFYMHRTGHWLGLDVHDVGEYRFEEQWRVFEPGMVTTVEPGIYIDQGLSDVPRQYRGIGIRIEDNVLVTAKGNEVITSMIPRTVEEVEIYMSKKGSSD